MFLGHYAVGFAAKKFAPRTSLGALIAAPLLLDLIWPIFLLLGWEEVRIDPGNTAFTPLDFVSYPYSHSLLTTFGWATAFALSYQLWARFWQGAVALWVGVLSHWFFDALVHRPDMPLYPGGPRVGLGIWNSIPATVAIESALFVAGLWLYVRATEPMDGIGKYGFWAYVVFLAAIYLASSGAPPPGAKALAVVALSAWLLVIWAWWFDSHRRSVQV